MPEHRLDAADVSAVDEQICGEGMAESMRMDVFYDAGFGGVIFDDPLNAPRGEAQTIIFFLLDRHEVCPYRDISFIFT